MVLKIRHESSVLISFQLFSLKALLILSSLVGDIYFNKNESFKLFDIAFYEIRAILFVFLKKKSKRNKFCCIFVEKLFL